MKAAKSGLMIAAAVIALWLIAVGFTKLVPPGAGQNGTLDQSECGAGAGKYDC